MLKHKVRLRSKTAVALFFAAGAFFGFLAGWLAVPAQNSGSLPAAGAVVLPALAGANAVEYINNNLLQGRGVVAELKSVNETSGFYAISFDIKKDGSVVQNAEVYATRDGKNLILGNIIDLTKAPEPPIESPPPEAAPKSEIPDVKMFVMAFCPFGKQAENGIGPAARLLGADVEPHFVIYSNYRGGGADFCIESGKYCSMHGIAELNEGIRQLCIYKNFKPKWWDYVDYVNSKCSLQNIESCWKDAANSVGIDPSAIENCKNTEGASLAKSEYELNQKYGVQGSPTILINGNTYNGGRSPEDFKNALCAAFKSPPAACSQNLGSSSQAPSASCS